jgi:hypothetical protein
MDSKLVPILWIITCATQVIAAHTRLEPVGRTYPIVEQDIREEFKQRATDIDIEALLNTHNRYQPGNLHPLPRASSDRMFTVDLTHTLDHDIKDNQGNLLYPRGFTSIPCSMPGCGVGWWSLTAVTRNRSSGSKCLLF